MEAPAHASSSSSSRHGGGGALEKLKSVVTKCAMASAPSKSLSVQHTAFIEKRIQELLPTPDHPPYAWMIENAIRELNLEGSCLDEEEKEAISNFISREYKGLHWAHSALLHHHFNKLSKTGDLITHHHNLIITSSSSPSPSPSPVSSSTPSYASTDQSSASSQSFERTRTRKKKKKKAKRDFRNKSGKLKKRMHARGMSNWDGEMMNQVQLGSDICLGGMGEVDIQSLLTEDETTNIHVPDQEQQQQQIIEAHGINDQHSGDDSFTPTTFPSNARRIRNRRANPRRKMRESESNVNGVEQEQDSMDELIEQVYGELTGTLDGEAAETGRSVQIHQTYDVINEQEQQQQSRKLVEKQKHIKEDQFGSGKPRPIPYRNVADIYESSSPARRSDGKSSRQSPSDC